MVLTQLTSIWLTTHSFAKLKWPKKVFFCLLQCCLFNGYVTFSKNNPNSRKSFLDFMSDITENLIRPSDVSSPSSSFDESESSSRKPTATPPKRAPKKPPGRLDEKIKNHTLIHIPATMKDKMPTRKCRVCVRNNIRKETRFLCAQCGVPLHLESCYTRYHTLKHY